MLDLELEQSVATVTSLADHFADLKLRVAHLKQVFCAIERGYFTPSEDDQVRQLLVSYSSSRNALIELVLAVYEQQRANAQSSPAAMAIAFAGALVLIDAAMFLRENFHDHYVVRTKLNEPDPVFGVPAGTYDQVQKSLTSPRHVWHLYYAVRYIRERWPQLQQIARDDARFEPIIGLIERYQYRLNVRRREYLWTRTRVRSRQFRTEVEINYVGRALYGLQKCVSRLLSERYTRSGHCPALPPAIALQLQSHMLAGDILVTRKEHALTNYFLPGYWPHVALYLGTLTQLEELGIHDHERVRPQWAQLVACDAERPGRVLEALKDGVRLRSVITPLSSDAVAIVRPRLDEQAIRGALCRGVVHAGKPYDFDFDFTRADRMVCTEVIYRTFDGVGGLTFQLVKRAGRWTISAEDILARALVGDGFDIHAVYAPIICPDDLCLGEQATTAIRHTMGLSS